MAPVAVGTASRIVLNAASKLAAQCLLTDHASDHPSLNHVHVLRHPPKNRACPSVSAVTSTPNRIHRAFYPTWRGT